MFNWWKNRENGCASKTKISTTASIHHWGINKPPHPSFDSATLPGSWDGFWACLKWLITHSLLSHGLSSLIPIHKNKKWRISPIFRFNLACRLRCHLQSQGRFFYFRCSGWKLGHWGPICRRRFSLQFLRRGNSGWELSWENWEDVGLSENVGYIPNYSHLIGILIINHWV